MIFKSIEIPRNKLTLFILLIGSLVFVALGIWLIYYEITTPFYAKRRPYFGYLIGPASILFFGIGVNLTLKALLSRKPALIIDLKGITNNTGLWNVVFIPWSDITKVTSHTEQKQNFVNIFLKNPNEYIDREQNWWKRKIMQWGMKRLGTFVSISSYFLKCDHDKLRRQIDYNFKKYASDASLHSSRSNDLQ